MPHDDTRLRLANTEMWNALHALALEAPETVAFDLQSRFATVIDQIDELIEDRDEIEDKLESLQAWVDSTRGGLG